MRTVFVKALIVRNDGRFLMIKHGNKWDIPGALVTTKKSTVTLLEAVKKECGIIIDIIRPVSMQTRKEGGKQVFDFILLCRYKSGRIKLGKGYADSKWAESKQEEDYMQVGK